MAKTKGMRIRWGQQTEQDDPDSVPYSFGWPEEGRCLEGKDEWLKFLKSFPINEVERERMRNLGWELRSDPSGFEVKLVGRFEFTFDVTAPDERAAWMESMGQFLEWVDGICDGDTLKVWVD